MCWLGGETALSPLPKGKVFAMIAKFTMHSEIAAPLFLIQTTSFCIITIFSLLESYIFGIFGISHLLYGYIIQLIAFCNPNF